MTKAHIDHIGIIVDDLEASVKMFTGLLGDGPIMTKEMPDMGLKIAEFETANVMIELLQYTGSNDAFAKEVLGEKSGVNHISLRVGEVSEAIAKMEAAGAETMDGFPRGGAHGEVAFFKPESTNGVLLEICQPDNNSHE
ncbi:MAG: VOC family protein [Rhizobiales bacterium]|nr:VOC family protein [Hyphomicrobiales bacterium]